VTASGVDQAADRRLDRWSVGQRPKATRTNEGLSARIRVESRYAQFAGVLQVCDVLHVNDVLRYNHANT